MSLPRRIALRWLQLAGVATACALLCYFLLQQDGRQGANDPQVQLAHEAARQLAAGRAPDDVVASAAPVELSASLAPFLMAVDAQGAVIASSGRLHGAVRTVPAGVFGAARRSGEDRVSWQPEPGVRIATVVVAYPGGFVVAGRSLAENEARTAVLGDQVRLAWLATLVGLGGLVTVTERLLGRTA